jgi:hypothetical protein
MYTPMDDRDQGPLRNTKRRNRGCSSEDWRGKHCMFVILLVGVKLKHVVMEQDFQL